MLQTLRPGGLYSPWSCGGGGQQEEEAGGTRTEGGRTDGEAEAKGGGGGTDGGRPVGRHVAHSQVTAPRWVGCLLIPPGSPYFLAQENRGIVMG